VKKLLSLLGCLLPTAYCLLPTAHAQTAYEHISATGIYHFLDEMATEKHILLNTAIKPYPRTLIAEKLKELTLKQDQLNKRQKAELQFYLREFYIELQSDTIANLNTQPLKPYHQKNNHTLSLLPPIYAFNSKPFSLNFRPYGGGEGYTNTKATLYNSYFGGSIFLYGWKNIAIYANYRDAYQAKEVLAMPTYLTQSPGANYKLNNGNRPGGDYSEMRGGITYTYKWFNIGIVKDHVQWGNNYNGSNILSGRTPSFAMLKLQIKPTKWFELNYLHGWLVSEEVDSARTYYPGSGVPRTVYRDKYIASNFITIGPVKGVALSLGNSIIYSDVNVQPAYFIPFLFYKSVDHTLNHGIDNQNSQIFFDLSIRSLKHLHVYSSVYIDEFSVTRIKDKDRRNFYSIKAGAKVNNFPFNNIAYFFEFTQSTPLTYTHRVPALTYASNKFNMGHYLGDNAREYAAGISYKPIRQVFITAGYALALKGKENPYAFISGGTPVDEYPFLDTITWQNQQISLNVSYEFAYNCKVDLTYIHSNTTSKSANNQTPDYYLQRYSPAFLHGRNNTFTLGLHFGF
jgi:hypothetical protein